MDNVISWWAQYPLLSVITLTLLVIVVMYLSRATAHRIILRFMQLLRVQFRMFARVCLKAEQRMRLRNYEVTKALAEQLLQRRVEREFIHVEKMLEKDLLNYKKMAASINSQLSLINQDYEDSSHVPPPAPEWVAAVDSIAALEAGDHSSEMMGKILADMHQTIQTHQRETLREHRWNVSARHKTLAGLRPQWQKLNKILAIIDSKMDALNNRLKQLDLHMTRFEMMASSSSYGFMSSVLVRFVASGLFLAIGVITAMVHVELLQPALSMLLTEQQVLGASLVTFSALLLVAMTLMASLMLFDSLRVTHLLPLMAAMSRRGRYALIYSGGGLLASLSVISGLLISGVLINTELAFGQSIVEMSLSQWTLLLLGVSTTMVVALTIMPLEYFLHTIRPITSSLAQLALHGMAFSLRMLAAMSTEAGKLLVQLYDLIIFVPLRIEQERSDKRGETEVKTADSQAVSESQPASSDSNQQPVEQSARNVRSVSFGVDRGNKG